MINFIKRMFVSKEVRWIVDNLDNFDDVVFESRSNFSTSISIIKMISNDSVKFWIEKKISGFGFEEWSYYKSSESWLTRFEAKFLWNNCYKYTVKLKKHCNENREKQSRKEFREKVGME